MSDKAQPADQTSYSRLSASLLVLVMGVTWGASVSLGKIAAGGGGHPLGLNFWNGLIGGGVLLTIALIRRRPPSLRPQALRFYVICSILGSVAPGTLLFFVLPKIQAGVVSITFAIVPLLTYAIAFLLRREVMTPLRLLGLVLGLTAVGLIVLPEESLPQAGQAVWVLLLLLCSLSYAGEVAYIDIFRPARLDALALTAGMLLMSSVLIAPFMIAFDGYVDLFVPWQGPHWALVAMGATSAIAYALFLHVIRAAGPVFASQTAYVVTLSGVLWGMAIFGETHSGYIWAALAIMMVGLSLVRPRT